MPRKRKIDPLSETDADALHAVILAIVQGSGHGGLTYVAEQLGMTPSAMRKRILKTTGAFDQPTLRATLLVAQSKAENYLDCSVESTTEFGDIIIETRNVGGALMPTWRMRAS